MPAPPVFANLEHPNQRLRAGVVDRVKLGEDARLLAQLLEPRKQLSGTDGQAAGLPVASRSGHGTCVIPSYVLQQVG